MKINLKILALVSLLIPSFTYAALGDVNLNSGTTLSVGGINLVLSTNNGSTLDSIVVGTSSFDVTMTAGSRLEIASADRRILSIPDVGSVQVTRACSSTSNDYVISNPSGGVTPTYTI